MFACIIKVCSYGYGSQLFQFWNFICSPTCVNSDKWIWIFNQGPLNKMCALIYRYQTIVLWWTYFSCSFSPNLRYFVLFETYYSQKYYVYIGNLYGSRTSMKLHYIKLQEQSVIMVCLLECVIFFGLKRF